MMKDGDQSGPREVTSQVDEQRRILAKTGVIAPVVLGSLLSRQVLGQTPYNCTMSGRLSGGSTHGTEVDCATLGLRPESYGQSMDWPGGLDPGALFNTVFADAYSYFEVWGNLYLVASGTDRSSPNPTLLQVLNATNTGMSAKRNFPGLGRAAVASWLNAYSRPDYPLSPSRVIDMFNAVYAGGSYQVNSEVSWNADQVKAYFESLY